MLVQDKDFINLSADMIIAAYDKKSLSDRVALFNSDFIDYTSIYLKGDIMFLPFPGTENIIDALLDADILLHSCEVGAIHQGAWTRFNDYIKLVEVVVKEHKPRKLIISGHSMGAWVATLVAAYFSTDFAKEDLVLNLFASPKIGTEAYVEYYSKLPMRINSFASTYDIVPTIPLCLYHVTTNIKLKFPETNSLDILENHSIHNYRLAIGKIFI